MKAQQAPTWPSDGVRNFEFTSRSQLLAPTPASPSTPAAPALLRMLYINATAQRNRIESFFLTSFFFHACWAAVTRSHQHIRTALSCCYFSMADHLEEVKVINPPLSFASACSCACIIDLYHHHSPLFPPLSPPPSPSSSSSSSSPYRALLPARSMPKAFLPS